MNVKIKEPLLLTMEEWYSYPQIDGKTGLRRWTEIRNDDIKARWVVIFGEHSVCLRMQKVLITN